MSSLFGTMSLSLRALSAQQAALQTTSDNIANVNTSSYSRKRAILVEDVAYLEDGTTRGNGVHVERIESLRDRVLELRICQETQNKAALQSHLGAMNQLDTLFSDVDNGINSRLDKFFTSISALASDPTNVSQRQGVLLAGANLAAGFRNAAKDIKSLQATLDANLEQNTNEINELSTQIAELNKEIATAHSGDNSSALEDRRGELLRQLSEKVDITVIRSDQGLTLTTGSGAPLVVGGRSFALATKAASNGLRHIYSDGEDVTSTIQSGTLGGLLRARDTVIPLVLEKLNTLAGGIAMTVNEANAAGFDLYGNNGAHIFEAGDTDAAANLRLVMSDPKQLGASSDGSVGDIGNLKSFDSVRNGPVIAGEAPLDHYANLVTFVGSQTADAKADLGASELILSNLVDQRGAVSGVSIDEEAANLVRYQRAFEASARVISVVDEMLQTLLAMAQR